jgi:hypothetical protein
MWIPSHVVVMGNERADHLTDEAVQGDTEFAALIRPLSRVRMLDGWQCSWSEGGMGKYTYSILTSVSLVPWFRRFDSNRCVVTSINRMMSNHSCLRSHLERINIVENLLGDYETIDHVMWSCKRRQLWNDFGAWWTPVRDLLGCRDWRGLRECCSFLIRCNLKKKEN